MGRQTHIGYHNCRDQGGYDFLLANVPFMSGNGDNQWLTQGYYFWTDSTYWAEKWNPGCKTTISEFSITFDQDDELLDLVGNTRQIFEFQTMRNRVAKDLKIGDVSKVTVSQVIAFFRELETKKVAEGIFPYLAVKAQDTARIGFFERMTFTLRRPETLACITRQQMCVFSHAKERITFNRFVSPDAYCKR